MFCTRERFLPGNKSAHDGLSSSGPWWTTATPQLWLSARCWVCWPQCTSLWPWALSTGTSTAARKPNARGATPPSSGRSSSTGSLMRRLTATPCSGWTAPWDCGGGASWCPASRTGSKSQVCPKHYISAAFHSASSFGYTCAQVVVPIQTHVVQTSWCYL